MGQYKKHSLYSGLVLTVAALATGMALSGHAARADANGTAASTQPVQATQTTKAGGQTQSIGLPTTPVAKTDLTPEKTDQSQITTLLTTPTAPKANSNPAVTAPQQGNTTTPSGTVTNNGYSWKQQNGNYYWQNAAGQKLTGWQQINGSWYYLGTDGAAEVNTWFQSQAQNWFYFGQDGAAQTGWQTINGNKYYFDPTNAWAAKGWQRLSDRSAQTSWYYFDPTNAWAAKSQWFKSNAGFWYYFNGAAQAETGFQTINNRNYHFDEVNASADTSWKFLNGKWYYYDPTNAWTDAGWQYLNGHWYFLNNYGQAMVGRHQLSYNGQTNWYWFDINNAWLYSSPQFIDGGYYVFNPDGSQVIGWQNNNTIYYDPAKAGQRASGQVSINGSNYYFDPATGEKATGLVLVKFENKLYLYDQNGRQETFSPYYRFNADGSVIFNDNGSQLVKVGDRYFNYQQGRFQTGWDQINGKWYDFTKFGYATTGWASINNKWYYFDPASAKAMTGWYQSATGFWYYFDPTNAWAWTGWQKLNGSWYYFDPTNASGARGWKMINNSWYYFDPANAAAKTGWQQISGKWYYFNLTSTAMVTGAQWINGKEYIFDAGDGHWISDSYTANVLAWFYNRQGKLTYSMYGSRNGADGTADCSGSVTQALYSAGASAYSQLYNTENLHGYLLANGYRLVYENSGYTNPQAGDVVIWGRRGYSSGAGGHTGVVSGSGSNAYFISTSYYTSGATGTAVQNLPYFSYWASDGYPYYYVYRR